MEQAEEFSLQSVLYGTHINAIAYDMEMRSRSVTKGQSQKIT
ncbi:MULTISPECIES: hypothetical protein [unclassified Moorena]|nr:MULTISPECIES: hypothetical protein [unclassified Moorena]